MLTRSKCFSLVTLRNCVTTNKVKEEKEKRRGKNSERSVASYLVVEL